MKCCRAIAVIIYFIIIKYSCGLTDEVNTLGDLKMNESSFIGPVRVSVLKTEEITETNLQSEIEKSKSELQQHHRESSHAKKVLTYKSTNVDINLQLVIHPATSTSVSISWNATVNRNPYSFDNLKKIVMKIVYRPFGSVLESEIILLMETVDNQTSFNFSSEYSIGNLMPTNGYIFCFSITQQNEESEIIQDVEKENLESKEPIAFPNNPSSLFDQETYEDPIFFPSKDFTFGYVPSLQEHHQSPSSDSDIRQPINPLISSLLRKPPTSLPNRKQNVAYSSTGELIYLPSSSWSPFSRKRRTLNYFRGTLLEDAVKNEKGRFCVEIFTRTEKAEELNLIGFIIIALTIFGIAMFIIITIVILVKILQCCKLPTAAGNESESIEDHQEEVENCTNNTNSINDKFENVIEKVPNEANTEETDSGISQVVQNCINSSNQYVRADYKTTECTHHLPKQSTDSEEDFHPGYEIPPSSMVEVYGYDFPRPINKYYGHLLSPALSSCELNDQVTEFSWDKYNLDIPRKENNKLTQHNKIDNLDTKEKLARVVNKFETYHPSTTFSYLENERNCLRKKSRPPTDEVFCKLKEFSRHAAEFRLKEQSISPKISSLSECHSGSHVSSRKKRSIGDIIITGGTLIEVPEGYASPATSKTTSGSSVLRIVVG